MDDRYRLAALGDEQLLTALKGLVRREHFAIADMLAHLAELDERRLFLDLGCPSLFAYWTAASPTRLAADASRPASVLLRYITAVCAFVAPRHPGAGAAIIDRGPEGQFRGPIADSGRQTVSLSSGGGSRRLEADAWAPPRAQRSEHADAL